MMFELLHYGVLAKHTDERLRALSAESPLHPESVQKYLEGNFGDALEDLSKAMLELAESLPAPQLAEKAYACTRNSGRRFLQGKGDGGPLAN